MPEFTVTRQIDAPVETVWEVLHDFGDIQRWSPGVTASALTSQGPISEGSTRHCDFAPFGGVDERIDRHEPNKRLTVNLYETFKLPISGAVADFNIAPHNDGTIHNSGASPLSSNWSSSNSGDTDDWFRFSLKNSVVHWTEPRQTGLGLGLARLYWNRIFDFQDNSGYYDEFSILGRIIRLHQYTGAVDPLVTVAVEIMQPTDPADDISDAVNLRTISLTLPTTPPLDSVRINGPLVAFPNTFCQWVAAIYGGSAPRTWYKATIFRGNPGPWSQVATGGRYETNNVGRWDFLLRVDAVGPVNTVADTISVDVSTSNPPCPNFLTFPPTE